jgi:hypothetical protein
VTDDEVRQFLEDNGYPQHVVDGGSAYILARYRAFVSEVERGYEFGLHEYRHDLDLRAALSTLGLDDEVAPEDERLAEMLTGIETRVWESMAGTPFWDFGYPKNARGRLARDLRTLLGLG